LRERKVSAFYRKRSAESLDGQKVILPEAGFYIDPYLNQ
jgi:hypothetical protein